MRGDPYRQSAEPVDEVYDDVAQFRRTLDRQRQSALLIAGYVVVSLADFMAWPSLLTIAAIVVIPLPGIAALHVRDKCARRSAS